MTDGGFSFTARDYEPISITSSLSQSPRFGYPRDFSLLFSDDSKEVNDYILGLLFVGCLTLCVLTTWGVLLCIFKCMGPNVVGYFSGHAFTFDGVNPEDYPATSEQVREPSTSGWTWASIWTGRRSSEKRASNMYRGDENGTPNTNAKRNVEDDYRRARQFSQRNNIIRVVFICSASVYAVFSVLAVTKGVTGLQNTLNVLNKNTENVNILASEARDIVQSGLRDTAELARSVRSTLRLELNRASFCPTNPELENFEKGRIVFSQGQEALGFLEALDDFKLDEFDAFEDALNAVVRGTDNVQDNTGDLDLTNWEAMIVIIPYVIVPCIFIAASFMAFFDVTVPCLNSCINWILLPLFIFMTAMAIVVSSTMIMGAGINSDFCLPGGRGSSPDDTVRQITQQYGFNGTLVYDIIDWYVSQCRTANPFEFLSKHKPAVESGLTALGLLESSLSEASTVEELALRCQRDFEPIEQVADSMNELLGILVRSMSRSVDMLDCDTVVPIYTSTAYDGTCRYSMSAVFWIFASTLLLSVSGLLMLTFRSSCKLDVYTDQFVPNTGPGNASEGSDGNDLSETRA